MGKTIMAHCLSDNLWHFFFRLSPTNINYFIVLIHIVMNCGVELLMPRLLFDANNGDL